MLFMLLIFLVLFSLFFAVVGAWARMPKRKTIIVSFPSPPSKLSPSMGWRTAINETAEIDLVWRNFWRESKDWNLQMFHHPKNIYKSFKNLKFLQQNRFRFYFRSSFQTISQKCPNITDNIQPSRLHPPTANASDNNRCLVSSLHRCQCLKLTETNENI